MLRGRPLSQVRGRVGRRRTTGGATAVLSEGRSSRLRPAIRQSRRCAGKRPRGTLDPLRATPTTTNTETADPAIRGGRPIKCANNERPRRGASGTSRRPPIPDRNPTDHAHSPARRHDRIQRRESAGDTTNTDAWAGSTSRHGKAHQDFPPTTQDRTAGAVTAPSDGTREDSRVSARRTDRPMWTAEHDARRGRAPTGQCGAARMGRYRPIRAGGGRSVRTGRAAHPRVPLERAGGPAGESERGIGTELGHRGNA